jgi:hypothetical protein
MLTAAAEDVPVPVVGVIRVVGDVTAEGVAVECTEGAAGVAEG